VNPDLYRKRLDSGSERRVVTMLRGGPWCWPSELDRAPWELAVSLVPDGPPNLVPGQVPLVAVTKEQIGASLFCLCMRAAGGATNTESTPFSAEVRQVWDDAALALPRSLPLLWTSVREAHDAPRPAFHLTTRAVRVGVAVRPTELKGPSFGLAFLLALASRVLGKPLPADIVASATVSADGQVGPVDGLPEKIAVVEAEAPRIRRFLVAADQAQDARAIASAIEIVAVRSAGHAIELVFGDEFRRFLAGAGSDPAARAELVDSFFRLVLSGRQAVVDWRPVEQGAAIACSEWPDLDALARWKLEFTRAVAARHENNRGEIPIPQPELLNSFPAPVRVGVVVQLVQQCADTGRPDPSVLQDLIKRLGYLVPIQDAFAPHLKLWGAYARLLAVTGQPHEALRIQEALAKVFLCQFEYDQISYQLSEWYRLAGACDDRAAFDRAEDMCVGVTKLGGLGFAGKPFVSLTRARAMVCLQISHQDDPAKTLESLSRDLQLPTHLRWSAARSYALMLTARGEVERQNQLVTELEQAAEQSSNQAQDLRIALTLCRIDLALTEACCGSATDPLLDQLKALDPGPLSHLLKAAAGVEPARYVARFYPY